MTLRSVPWWDVRLLLSTLVLVTSACDEFPGIDAIGIQRGPGGEIEVVKPLCSGDRVTEVSLIRAPEGHLDDSEGGVLWQITSKTGSRQDMYVVGTTGWIRGGSSPVPGARRSRGACGNDRQRILHPGAHGVHAE